MSHLAVDIATFSWNKLTEEKSVIQNLDSNSIRSEIVERIAESLYLGE